MKETLLELDVPFSTADTEGKVELFYKNYQLEVRFWQWDRKETNVVFDEVAGFRWDDNYLGSVEVPPDRIYEVMDSSWMLELEESGRLGNIKRHHYRLYFISEASAIDVIASKMKLKDAEQGGPHNSGQRSAPTSA